MMVDQVDREPVTITLVDYAVWHQAGSTHVFKLERWSDQRVTMTHMAEFDDPSVADKFCSTWRGR